MQWKVIHVKTRRAENSSKNHTCLQCTHDMKNVFKHTKHHNHNTVHYETPAPGNLIAFRERCQPWPETACIALTVPRNKPSQPIFNHSKLVYEPDLRQATIATCKS
ncbi:b2.1 [Tranosema rostrale ichnovirus]|nr:b2.1 [Tranosema rostrale ichnovirus]